MHIMSKKRIKLRRDADTEKVQNPSVVLTADGEMHTHEEAQVFVHDLNLFVTVLLLGKLCEDHGYSYHLLQNDYSFDALQTYCFGINIKL